LLQCDSGIDFGLNEALSFEEIFFDSTCLKAAIHYPIDWILLRDATRTLMKATDHIRKSRQRCRMPKEPLSFFSDMNTPSMEMTAKNRTKEGKKHRKRVFRKMKALLQRVQRYLDVLKVSGEETDLSPGVIQNIITQMEGILSQVPTVIKQTHERMIGGRKVLNKGKIFSLYDEDVQVVVRGKSNAEVEFGNNLWIGENRSGFIVDYLLEKEKTSDAKQVEPAIKRLVEEQSLQIKSVCGDRGLHSAANEELLKSHGIDSWFCTRVVSDLSERLKNEPEIRRGGSSAEQGPRHASA
jgi:hypothetical protein